MTRSPVPFMPMIHLPSVLVGGYLVAARCYPGVSLEEAAALAEEQGCELPTKALIDAIYTDADCKLNAYDFAEATDGTAATMAAPSLILRNYGKTLRAVARWEEKNGHAARLVVGTNKYVIRNPAEYTSAYGKIVPAGALGIYGYHDNHGKPIQGANYVGAGPRSHVPSWRDYSQAAWLVRPAT